MGRRRHPADARVGLVQPELAFVPAGAIVEAATLHLWIGPSTNDYAIDPALVNRWLADPTTKHGVAIVASGIDGACWVTNEGAVGKRPGLVVTWRLPASDVTP